MTWKWVYVCPAHGVQISHGSRADGTPICRVGVGPKYKCPKHGLIADDSEVIKRDGLFYHRGCGAKLEVLNNACGRAMAMERRKIA